MSGDAQRNVKKIENKSLKNLNSLGIDKTASNFFEVDAKQDLLEVISIINEQDYAPFLIGSGNNLAFADDSPLDCVIKINAKRIETVTDSKDVVHVRVEAGHDWNDFVHWTVKRNLWGVENLVLIPGTTGAAPVQNIGAYGQEIKSSIVSIEVLDLHTGKYVELSNTQCNFGFRRSIFNTDEQGRYIIFSVLFKLTKSTNPILKRNELSDLRTIRNDSNNLQLEIVEKITSLRTNGKNLPNSKTIGSCGTFFKTLIIRNRLEFLRILFILAINLKIQLFGKTILFAIKYYDGKEIRIPTKIILSELIIKDKKFGAFSLFATNKSVVISDLEQVPSSKDLTTLIAFVQRECKRIIGREIPIEPEIM